MSTESSASSGTPAGIAVRLADEVDAGQRASIGALVPPGARALWQALIEQPVALRAIESGQLPLSPSASAGVDTEGRGLVMADAFLLLAQLWASQALVLASSPSEAALEISAGASDEPLDLGVGPIFGRPWRVSRFASFRGERSSDGTPAIVIEQPLSAVRARVAPGHAARVAAFFAWLLEPRRLEAGKDNPAGGGDPELLFLFAIAGVAAPADAQGALAEDRDPVRRQWEHHDLLMHFHSRLGRHSHDMGAGFRFKGILEAQPALKPNPWRGSRIALPRPDLHAAALRDPPFTAVLEARRSIRAHNHLRPIGIAQLGEFLYRSARVRTRYMTEIGEFTSRPYPGGGASHELEIYLSVDHAQDLLRGYYYYDPAEHALCLVRGPNPDMESLLHDAWTSSARMCRPQVLITIASRFQRVSWKYSGMAYATQLKNVGVLFQTFYLVATAMNLAGCALGLGNAGRFSRMTGTNYLHESSVGEFMLGVAAD